MIRQLKLTPGITGEVALQRAEHTGWLVPSVRPRRGQGDPTTHGAIYNDDDVYVGRVVLSAYPLDYPATAARNRLRVDLARRLRQFHGWRYAILCANPDGTHGGSFCDDADLDEVVLDFIASHPGQVVTVVDLAALDPRKGVPCST